MPGRVDPLHEQGSHHWLITLHGIGSRSGTCTPLQGETRYDLYLRIRAEVLDAEHRADGPVPPTLFFDLQDNTMTGDPHGQAEEGHEGSATVDPLHGHW